jgi:circadian clock protein KaiA
LTSLPSQGVRPQLTLCLFLSSPSLPPLLAPLGQNERFNVVMVASEADFYALIEQNKQNLDCLVLEDTPQLPHWVNWLQGQSILLPTVILPSAAMIPPPSAAASDFSFIYHAAEVILPIEQLEDLVDAIDQAITAFLDLSPFCLIPDPASPPNANVHLTTQNFLMLQQHRLTQKLKERLGYLGVYYKRDAKNFFRHLSPAEQSQLLEQLQVDYRDIILRYFLEDHTLNQKIDDFVNMAFFADISVAQIVEIHMQLMDEFSKQLKLEGRSEEVLLDYRLTLIDTIAHLCEMYRRSIPRKF